MGDGIYSIEGQILLKVEMPWLESRVRRKKKKKKKIINFDSFYFKGDFGTGSYFWSQSISGL